jgi:hypothetical protein
MNVRIRKALAEDIPRLRKIIEASVRGLQANDYSPAQIEGALKSVYGVDSQLIADATYLVAEESASTGSTSSRGGGANKTLYGGDQYPAAKTRCSTLHTTPPRSVPSCIRRRAVALAA